MPNTEEQTRYIEALCQIETGIQHNGQLYLPFADLVTMVRRMPQTTLPTLPIRPGHPSNPETYLGA